MVKDWVKNVFKLVKRMEETDVLFEEVLVQSSKSLLAALQRLQVNSSMALRDVDRSKLILRLKAFLLHKNASLVRNVATVLMMLTEECLTEEIALSLFKQVIKYVDKVGSNMTECSVYIFELLSHLMQTNTDYRALFVSSECLQKVLQQLQYVDAKDNFTMVYLPEIVNVLIASSCDPPYLKSRIEIIKILSPWVITQMENWVEDSDASTNSGLFLKEILFLTREIIYRNAPAQNIFLQHKGLEILLRILSKTDVMEEHMDIIFPQRPTHKDYSETLFSSIVIFLDCLLTHNRKVCAKAEELKAFSILQHYLNVTPDNQQAFVITTIVHLLEENIGTCPSRQLTIQSMHKIVKNGIQVRNSIAKFLEQNSKNEEKNIKHVIGTPYPRKLQSRIIKQSIRRRSRPWSPPVSQETAHKSTVLLAYSQAMHEVEASGSKFKKVFVNLAELILLMKYVGVYGINMKAVRSRWLFHKHLTAGDLFALWRSLWRKFH